MFDRLLCNLFIALLFGDGWDGTWAGYASLVSIELYNSTSSNYYFRIIYNGNEMMLPGCTEMLCEVDSFLSATAFAEEPMDCSVVSSTTTASDSSDEYTDDQWMLICILSCAMTVIVTIVTLLLLQKYGYMIVYSHKEVVLKTAMSDEGGHNSENDYIMKDSLLSINGI